MNVNDKLKEFLTQQKILDLIDEYNYDAVYELCEPRLRPQLTDFLLNVMEIDPLQYMKVVPAGYASGITSVESITLPNQIQEIGSFAFSHCISLTNITIPDSVTTMGNRVFSDCSNLTSITIPGVVKSIGAYAFKDCYNLRNVTIGNGVTSIGYYAFTRSGVTSMIIPDSVTSIDDGAFNDCSNLETIKFTGTIAEWNNVQLNKTTFRYVPARNITCIDGTTKLRH